MSKFRLPLASAALAAVALPAGRAGRPCRPTAAQFSCSRQPQAWPRRAQGRRQHDRAFMSPSSPLEVSAAKKADKVAWVVVRARHAQRLRRVGARLQGR